MTASTTTKWESKRTPETREVEAALSKSFERVDAYRYNSASIRIRVIDSKFESKPRDERDRVVEEQIAKLPEKTRRDIVTIFCFAPSELRQIPETFREYMLNTEFDDPSPSML